MSKNIEQRDVDDGLELPQELVRDPSSQYRCEVAERGEGVVDGCGLILNNIHVAMQIFANLLQIINIKDCKLTSSNFNFFLRYRERIDFMP